MRRDRRLIERALCGTTRHADMGAQYVALLLLLWVTDALVGTVDSPRARGARAQ